MLLKHRLSKVIMLTIILAMLLSAIMPSIGYAGINTEDAETLEIGVETEGDIDEDTPEITISGDHIVKGVVYKFEENSDTLYKFNLSSSAFSTRLYLLDSQGEILNNNEGVPGDNNQSNSTLSLYSQGGTYYLVATYSGYTPQTGSFTITANTVTEGTGKITGHIGDQTSGSSDLAGIKVALYNESEEYIFTHTDSDGNYSLTAEYGTYKIGCSDPDGNYQLEFYNEKETLDEADEFSLAVAPQVIDFSLALGGNISGNVTAAGISSFENKTINVTILKKISDDKYSEVATTTVNPDGSYIVNGLRVGMYYVQFSDEHNVYLDQYYATSGGVELIDDANPVSVTSDATTENINATLIKGGSITGTVAAISDDESFGIDDITVDLYQEFSDGEWIKVDRNATYTNNGGFYTITGLKAGTYRVGFDGSEYGFVPIFYSSDDTIADSIDYASDVEIVIGEDTSDINAIIEMAPYISGIVKDTTGDAIQGVRVEAYEYEPTTSGIITTKAATAWTEEDGYYYLINLDESKKYKVKFTGYMNGMEEQSYNAQYYNQKNTILAADTLGFDNDWPIDTNATLAAFTGSTISGKVTNSDDSGIAGIKVTLLIEGDDGWVNEDKYTAVTGSDGTYSISGAIEGSYIAFFSAEDASTNYIPRYYESGTDGTTSQNDSTVLSVYDGSAVTGVAIKMSKGASLSGRVTSDGTAPIEDITATLYNKIAFTSGAATWFEYEQAYSAKTNSEGYFTINGIGITTGAYVLEYSDSNSRYFTQYWDNKETMASATGITISDTTALTGYNATMVAGYSMTGVVTDVHGNGINDINVKYYQKSGSQTWITAGSMITGYDGSYKIEGLKNGDYKVEFSGDNYNTQYWENSKTSGSATEINISNEDKSGINAQMYKKNAISGNVKTEESGNLVSLGGINVSLLNADEELVLSTETDSDGEYAFDGITDGAYYIEFSKADGSYSTQYWTETGPMSSITETEPFDLDTETWAKNINATMVLAPGTIAGTIKDSISENVLAGVTVEAFMLLDGAYQSVTSTATDTNGKYSLSDLEPGTYKVKATFEDYIDQYWNGSNSIDNATEITLDHGTNRTADFSLVMVTPGSISGTVTNLKGTTVSGITVTVFYKKNDVWTEFKNTVSDADGNYKLEGLTVKDYILEFKDGSNAYRTIYWTEDGGTYSKDDADVLAITEGKEITGKDIVMINMGTFTVTFDENGAEAPVSNVTVTPGSVIGDLYPADPVKEGYIFEGWYNGDTKLEKNSPTIIDNITFTAKWKITQVKVTLDADGGTVAGAASKTFTIDWGTSLGALYPEEPKKYGYKFLGWLNNDNNLSAATVIKQDVTYTAGWEYIAITVTLDANGGTPASTTVTAVTNDKYQGLPNPVRTGYTFAGWYKDPTNWSTGIANGDTVRDDEDFTVYARWTLATFKLIYNANGGNVSIASKNVMLGSAYGTLPSAMRKDYDFKGWFTARTGGTKVSAKDTFNVAKDINIFAQWTGANSTLKKVKASKGKFDKVFHANKTRYTVKLKKKQKATKITVTPTQSVSKVQIKVGSGKFKNAKSAKVSVKKGKSKTVTIKVTAENGKTKTYKVKVKRAKK